MKKLLFFTLILGLACGCAQTKDAKQSTSREEMTSNWECEQDEFLKIETCKNIFETERLGFSYLPYRWISVNKKTKDITLFGTAYTSGVNFPKFVYDNNGSELPFIAKYSDTKCYAGAPSCVSSYIFAIELGKDYLQKNKDNQNLKIKIIGLNTIIEIPNWVILGTLDYVGKKD